MNNSSIYTNGFYNGSGIGYQNGHLDGYNMAANEAHTFIANLKALHTNNTISLTKSIKKEIMELKKVNTELRANLDYSERDLILASKQYKQYEDEIAKLHIEISTLHQEAETLNNESAKLNDTHERTHQRYLTTANRCDKLILTLRDLDKDNTNKQNILTMNEQDIIPDLEEQITEWKTHTQEAKELAKDLKDTNQLLLNGFISIRCWLGKDNEKAYKTMLIRGGVPEQFIKDIF